jgi:hypothetical protein
MISTDTLADFLDDWKRHLRAAGKSDRTVSIYAGAALELIDFLESKGYPTAPGEVTRKHLEHFFGWLAERPNKNNPSKRVSPAYVNQQYRSLQQFFLSFTFTRSRRRRCPGRERSGSRALLGKQEHRPCCVRRCSSCSRRTPSSEQEQEQGQAREQEREPCVERQRLRPDQG